MTNPYVSNFDALGLQDHSPFDILSKPRAIPNSKTPPKKRGPKKNKTKVQQAAISLETAEERKTRQQSERKLLDSNGRARIDLAPRTTGAIVIYSAADQNRSRALAHGRQI